MTDCQTHRTNDPFVRFLKSIVLDSNISWKAKGILTYAFSRTNWKFYKSEMMKHATDGRESFTSGIKELEKYGYLWKEATQNPGTGQFESCIWHFYEDPKDNPQFQNNSTEERVSRLSDNLDDGKPVPIRKKDCLQEKDNNKEAVVVPSDQKEKEKIISYLTIPEPYKMKLLSTMSIDDLKILVKRVRNWKERENDHKACNTIIASWDTWSDAPNKEEKKKLKDHEKQQQQQLIDQRRQRAQEIFANDPKVRVNDGYIEIDRSTETRKLYATISFTDKEIDQFLDKSQV